MFDRFSEHARKSMSLARRAACDFKHDYIGTEHMLLGVLPVEGAVAPAALAKLGVDIARVRIEVEKIVRPGTHENEMLAQIPFTPRGKFVLDNSLKEAQDAGHHHIGTGHLLLGLLSAEGIAATVLNDLGVTLDAARPVVLELITTTVDPRDRTPGVPSSSTSPSFTALIKGAYVEATARGESVGAEHALLAMLQADGVAAQILSEMGVTTEAVRRRIGELRDSSGEDA